MTQRQPAWPDDIFAALRDTDVRQVAYVPDSGHARLIERCHGAPGMTAVPLTTEEEGVAMLAGAWLGGERGVLLMQSSGVGNCINMLGLPRVCALPLLMIVTMRGEGGEFNPWQLHMGGITADTLRLAGVTVSAVDAPERIGETVAGAAREVFSGSGAGATSSAVLIAQSVIGVKSFEDAE